MPGSVSVRRATVDDAPIIHAWRSEPSTGRYQPTLPLTLQDVRGMIAERAASAISMIATGVLQWVIEWERQPAGWITVSISPEDRRHAKGALGYTVGERFRGRGVGSAGVAALLPIAFGREQLALERLEAVAAITNTASRRVLERNGFQFEGVLRGLLVINDVRVDHAIYGLLRTDWEAL